MNNISKLFLWGLLSGWISSGFFPSTFPAIYFFTLLFSGVIFAFFVLMSQKRARIIKKSKFYDPSDKKTINVTDVDFFNFGKKSILFVFISGLAWLIALFISIMGSYERDIDYGQAIFGGIMGEVILVLGFIIHYNSNHKIKLKIGEIIFAVLIGIALIVFAYFCYIYLAKGLMTYPMKDGGFFGFYIIETLFFQTGMMMYFGYLMQKERK